jgi:hypothetical protein
MKPSFVMSVTAALALAGCTDLGQVAQPDDAALFSMGSGNGVVTVNGWYEGEEIYYIDGGREEGVTERGRNQIYLIDGPRQYQANVVLFIPGERGYSPHWNVNVVHTAEGVTVQDIIDAGFASDLFGEEPVLFDDAEDIMAAAAAGLVTVVKPGVVVLCPIISEAGAEAPGNTELPDDEFPKEFDLNAGF